MLFKIEVRPSLALRAGLPGLAALLVCLAAVVATAGEDRFSHGLLWQVEAAGAAPSYVYGTMHSADPVIATPSPALAAVLERIDSLTLELLLTPENEQALGLAMLLTDGRRLSDILGPERFARAAEIGASYGIPPEALEGFQPWGVMALFSLPVAEFRRQAQGMPMLDRVLWNTAGQRGIPVRGLESAEEQIAALSGDREADQVALLDMTLESHHDIDAFFDQMVQAYLDEDLAALVALTEKEAQAAPPGVAERFLEHLLIDRNHRMAERMAPLLAEGNALVAVGALHLYGDEGVLALLERQGYRVTRVE